MHTHLSTMSTTRTKNKHEHIPRNTPTHLGGSKKTGNLGIWMIYNCVWNPTIPQEFIFSTSISSPAARKGRWRFSAWACCIRRLRNPAVVKPQNRACETSLPSCQTSFKTPYNALGLRFDSWLEVLRAAYARLYIGPSRMQFMSFRSKIIRLT